MDLCSWCLRLLNLGFAAQTSSFGCKKAIVSPRAMHYESLAVPATLPNHTCFSVSQTVIGHVMSCDVMCEQGSSKLPTLVELECSKFKV